MQDKEMMFSRMEHNIDSQTFTGLMLLLNNGRKTRARAFLGVLSSWALCREMIRAHKNVDITDFNEVLCMRNGPQAHMNVAEFLKYSPFQREPDTRKNWSNGRGVNVEQTMTLKSTLGSTINSGFALVEVFRDASNKIF